MQFHTYTTVREACKRSGAIDDPEEVYRVAFTDAVKMRSGHFLGQPVPRPEVLCFMLAIRTSASALGY